MEIVRTALTGSAATTLFSEFLMRDQGAIAQIGDQDTCKTAPERNLEGKADVHGAIEGHEHKTFLAPCEVHVQNR